MPHLQPDGYLATPASDQGDGVLVLHAWWGVNDTIKALCRRLADAGFIAFAPDLYHGKVATTIADAETYARALEADGALAKAEVAQAAIFLSERVGEAANHLAVMGFSLGAYFAVDLASADPDHIRSVVLFYGSGDADVSKSKAAYLAHYAENDPYEPRTYADALEAALKRAGRPVTIYQYPGTTHWFFEPDRVEQYNEVAANLAWERTLAFLRR